MLRARSQEGAHPLATTCRKDPSGFGQGWDAVLNRRGLYGAIYFWPPRAARVALLPQAVGILSGKQEVTLARRVGNSYGGITPLDGRYVSRSEDTDPKQHVEDVPFLITASELRDRKIRRRGEALEARSAPLTRGELCT
jgi:hypothetical protein